MPSLAIMLGVSVTVMVLVGCLFIIRRGGLKRHSATRLSLAVLFVLIVLQMLITLFSSPYGRLFAIVVCAAEIVVVLAGCLFILRRGGLCVCCNCKQAAVFTPLGFSNVGRRDEAAAAPAAATPRTQPGSLGDDPAALWGCAHCTYLNAQRVLQCAECGAEKPAASAAGGGAQATDVDASPDLENGLVTDVEASPDFQNGLAPMETPSEEVLQRVSELFAQQEQRVAQLTPRRASTFVIDWVWVIDRWVLVV